MIGTKHTGTSKNKRRIFWAAHTLFVPIFLLAPQQKGFPLQSLPQYNLLKIIFSLYFYFKSCPKFVSLQT